MDLQAAIANGAAPLQEHWLQERIAHPLGEGFKHISGGCTFFVHLMPLDRLSRPAGLCLARELSS